MRDQALSICSAAGLQEVGDFRAGSLSTLVQMVAGGEGLTLLPQLAVAVEAQRAALALVPFRRPIPTRTIGFAWRPTSPRAEEFATLAASFAPPVARRSRRPARKRE